MASHREELRVHGVFKRDQAKLPPGDTLTIAVDPHLRLPTSTWEPDPLIFYRGRVGNDDAEVDEFVKRLRHRLAPR